MNDKTVAEILKEACKAKKVSLKSACEAQNINYKSVVVNYRRSQLSAIVLDKLAQELGLEVTTLIRARVA